MCGLPVWIANGPTSMPMALNKLAFACGVSTRLVASSSLPLATIPWNYKVITRNCWKKVFLVVNVLQLTVLHCLTVEIFLKYPTMMINQIKWLILLVLLILYLSVLLFKEICLSLHIFLWVMVNAITTKERKHLVAGIIWDNRI